MLINNCKHYSWNFVSLKLDTFIEEIIIKLDYIKAKLNMNNNMNYSLFEIDGDNSTVLQCCSIPCCCNVVEPLCFTACTFACLTCVNTPSFSYLFMAILSSLSLSQSINYTVLYNSYCVVPLFTRLRNKSYKCNNATVVTKQHMNNRRI